MEELQSDQGIGEVIHLPSVIIMFTFIFSKKQFFHLTKCRFQLKACRGLFWLLQAELSYCSQCISKVLL
jgi:hypothetical protein